MRNVLLILAISLAAAPACKRRSLKEIQIAEDRPSSRNPTGDTELDKLKQERNDLIAQLLAQQVEGARRIAELTLQRDELHTQKASVELAHISLQKDLAASTTPEERAEIQVKLNAAIKEREDIMARLQSNADSIKDLLKKMDTLSDEIRQANSKISDLNQRIESFEQELAIERSKVETIGGASLPKAPAPSASGGSAPTTPTTPPAAPTTGTVSQLAWQFYRQHADNTQSCFEFGSTLSGASLLGLPCVTPSPLRQQFKTESFGSQFLLVDQRTQQCVRLDSAAGTAASARVLLGACKRGGDMDELWTFFGVNIETDEFQLRSVKTGNCLHIAADKKVVQLPCDQAINFLSAPS